MKPSIPLAALALFAIALAPAFSQDAGDGTNLIKNGKFEMADAIGHPEDWTMSHPEHLKKCETTVELVSEGDMTFFRVTKNAATGPGIGWQKIQIPPNVSSLRAAK